ncbi:putative c6 transcription factor [Phaeomoniella chlamydospora]|uniref:Putative c6 transcription factor n=1 Tax=Phaeomoniella chlamydospora TaxID=158046 RepID=A0A0G2EM84_PHACM|nr:putative c6 transcription factor [Phaeomoniella chlamydospora]
MLPIVEESAVSFSGSNEDLSSGDEALSPRSRDRKRKRSNQKISCELCKARKVKCDRAEPACTWCARHNRECVYKERQKPGLKSAYGLELEAKINRLDALLQILGRRVEDHIVKDHIIPPSSTSTSPAFSQPLTTFTPYDNPIDTPNISAASYPKPPSSEAAWKSPEIQDFSRPAEMVTPGRASVQSFMSVSMPDTVTRPESTGHMANGNLLNGTGSSTDTDLPPNDMLYTLVDLYFKHVNTWCPILDRKATFGTFFGSTSLPEPDRILLHAIVATTLRFCKDPRLKPETRKRYHDASKHEVELYGLDHISVEALKALVILALDVLGASNGPRGWNLLALIARNIIHLDLCVESNVFLSAVGTPATGSLRRVALSQPTSWIEDEGRRRLCWMVYILDRYATVATTFDFMLNDQEMNRALPCRYDLFSKNEAVETRSFDWADQTQPESTLNKPENLGSFSYHCEVLRILSRIHMFLREPLDVTAMTDVQRWRTTYRALDGELNTWLHGLPGEYGKISQLCHSDPASRVANWIMLHAAFVTSVIRLHSCAAYPTSRSPIFMPSHYAMQRCLSAVESLRDIAQDVLDTKGLDLLGPPFAFSLWSSARLLLVHAATMECEVDPKIHFFVSTLRHMGQYWEVADNYSKILTRVVQEGQSGSMTFTAMRKCSYDLSRLASSKRRTVLEPQSTRVTTLNELEYIDVFDFFNYPRVPDVIVTTPTRSGMLSDTQDIGSLTCIRTDFVAPTPESDWLRFQPPYE